MEELAPLKQWFIVGTLLDIEQGKLTQIEVDYVHLGVQRCNVEMFHHWLICCHNPTWEKMANALDGAGAQGKARRVREKHCKKSAGEGVLLTSFSTDN